MPIALIVIDGLGDRPIKKLDGKTPLEAAYTPNMDSMAGLSGLVLPFVFEKEKTPTSEGAHAAIFGCLDDFLGRGPYEALGVGIELQKSDIAFRANYAILEEEIVSDRRAGRIKDTEALSNLLSGIEIDKVKFMVKSSMGHRAVLVMRGNNLSPEVSSNDPKEDGKPVKKIKALTKEAEFTAEVLNKFLHKAKLALKGKKANFLLLRGAGKFKETLSFKKKYNKSSCAIASGGVYIGIPKAMGIETVIKSSLDEKISTLKERLKEKDFVFCHIKETDNLSHDGDFLGKKEFIEKIDRRLAGFDKKITIAVTGDHSTPCELKDHSSDPVPLLIYRNGESARAFSEKECLKGELGKIRQEALLEKIFSYDNITADK